MMRYTRAGEQREKEARYVTRNADGKGKRYFCVHDGHCSFSPASQQQAHDVAVASPPRPPLQLSEPPLPFQAPSTIKLIRVHHWQEARGIEENALK